MKYRKTLGEKIFDIANIILLTALLLVTLYPCYYVVIASVSDPTLIYESNALLLYPKNFAAYSYGEVFANQNIWIGYRNTIFYVLAGTIVSVSLTISSAYALSRPRFPGKNLIMLLIMFTMYFSGGLIPTYMVVRNLKILDTPLAMIIPNAINVFNLIVTLNYFKGIPVSLEEAAKIDGAGEFRVFYQIFIPLAKPIIAVISLYYSVAIWNDFFSSMIYIRSRDLYSLQLILREILLQGDSTSVAASGAVSNADAAAYAANIKYATIVVSTVPILCVYPFIQKYFVKGVMVGAVKG